MDTSARKVDLPFLGERREVEVKVVLVGDANVGKTSLMAKVLGSEFDANETPTVGCGGGAVSMQTEGSEGLNTKFQIWDTAGSERYRKLMPMFATGAHVAIVVFDVTSAASFDGAKKWICDLKRIKRLTLPKLVVAIAANKCDLVDSRAISSETAHAFAQENEFLYCETTSKGVDGDDVRQLFLECASLFFERLVLFNPTTAAFASCLTEL
jgi:small GTP-binding protein